VLTAFDESLHAALEDRAHGRLGHHTGSADETGAMAQSAGG